MVNLFLCSSFSNVAEEFQRWVGESCTSKTVTFIPTASLTEKVTFYVKSAQRAFAKLGFILDEIDISSAPYGEVAEKIAQNDLLYISGGNTFFLLQELSRTGVDGLITEFIRSGKCYIGESAGAMIVSPNIEYAKHMDDPACAPSLMSYEGLGITDFHTLPHRNSFPFKKIVENIIVKYGSELKLEPISNSQAIGIKGSSISLLEK